MAANDAAPAAKYERASAHIKGIGKNLDSIQDRDVLLCGYDYGTRSRGGYDVPFVTLSIAVDLERPEEREEYHAWSDALGQRLQEIPPGALPVLAKFVRVVTAKGYRIWSIE